MESLYSYKQMCARERSLSPSGHFLWPKQISICEILTVPRSLITFILSRRLFQAAMESRCLKPSNFRTHITQIDCRYPHLSGVLEILDFLNQYIYVSKQCKVRI